jgi:hypothetical protein
VEEWRRLSKAAPRTLKELLLTDEARFDVDLPRVAFKRRAPIDLGD